MSGIRISHSAFTLAELLIALVILAEIATFTIPKILTTQANGASNAKAKEVAGMISAAFQQAQMAGTLNAGTVPNNLTQYMSYVSATTSGNLVDPHPTTGTIPCSASTPCLKLHNGGILQPQAESFGGTSNMNLIQFRFDPDGIYSGLATDNSGASIQFEIYYNGQLTTRGQVKSTSCHSGGCVLTPAASNDPTWFSW